MAVSLDPSLIRAIRAELKTPRGRKYDRWARKRYGVSGAVLAAKTVAGEGGGRSTKKMREQGIVSSAGARGPAQFIESTRNAYIDQYGVDPWKNDRSAIRGMMIHHMGTGVEGYNPGMPTYKDYILGQKIDPDSMRSIRSGLKGGGGRDGSGRGSHLETVERLTPGVSLEAERDALRQETLLTALSQGRMASQSELLALAGGLRELKDVPAERDVDLKVVRNKGRRGRGEGAAGALGRVDQDGWHGARSVGSPIAKIALQQGLQSVSEKRPTVNTASGGVSDHYEGNKNAYAWDLSNGSAPTKEMDRSAQLIARALGAGKQWKQQGRQGVLNVTKKIDGRTYRFQMLYRTNVGGNHYNHVHFGVSRVD